MKVCFVMPRAYDLAADKGTLHGGAELQMVRLARRFAASGVDVSFVTANPGRAVEETVQGVRVIPTFSEKTSLPVWKFVSMWRGIRRGLDRSDADIFIQRSASPLTGLVARYARRSQRLFIYMLSNDTNVDGTYESTAGLRDAWLYRRGLSEAHGIVAQTETQARLLRERHRRDAFVLPNAVEAIPDPPPVRTPSTVFWAASFQPHKRPHAVLDLARRAPDLKFVVAGALLKDPDLVASFRREAAPLSNVDYRGHLDRAAMEAGYLKAIAFLCTSEYEGFPNTFLEAWRLGIPVASLNVDPDEVICRYGLGVHSKNTGLLLQKIRRWRDHPDEVDLLSAAIRDYMRRHEEGTVAGDFLDWLERLQQDLDPVT